MKVLFVYPEHYLNVGIPGGISILSAILKRAGHQTAVFDTCFLKTAAESISASELHVVTHGGTKDYEKAGVQVFRKTNYTIEDLVREDPVVTHKDEFQKAIDSFKPDLIAVSVMTSTFDFAMDLLRQARYDVPVIVGGVHATIATDDCLNQKEVDIVCVGEGDDALLELCNRMERGEDYYNIPSLCFRMPDGGIRKNPLSPLVDVGALPCPDWGLFDRRHLFRPFDGKIYVGSFYSQSRGCPMQCTYCIDPTVAKMVRGSKPYFRIQPPEVTLSHLAELKDKFGATWYKFTDDTFLLPPIEHLQKLGDGLRELGIQFACSVMPNTITEEKVQLAKNMGCVAMSVGVESGNKEIRKMIRRNYSDETLINNLKFITDCDIRLSTFNIIGFPGETRENVFETIELNRKLGALSCNVYILFPYPGTAIQKEYEIPLRRADGMIMPVSEAKNLGLSKMSPSELVALQKTFNLYLILPRSLWNIIALAENANGNGPAIHSILSTYSVAILTSENLSLNTISESRLKTMSCRVLSSTPVPDILAGLFDLPLTGDERDRIVASLTACF
ncbi:MAG: radical SAM protein [Verrucomicrobiaceae bacterium]|nr:MAG: radical SAM protein [Verrucomicrobiaceae bacterium]